MRQVRFLFIFVVIFLVGCEAGDPAGSPASSAISISTSTPESSEQLTVNSEQSTDNITDQQPTANSQQPTATYTNLIIYDDQLADGWQNWSWGVELDRENSQVVQTGATSASARYNDGWGGIYWHSQEPINTGDFVSLRFWLHGGESGEHHLRISVSDDSDDIYDSDIVITTVPNVWLQVEIPLSELGDLAVITGVIFQEFAGEPVETPFYVDDVILVGGPPAPTPGPRPGPELHVDTSQIIRPINPDIYGLNFADQEFATEISLPVNRWGGNATTRYNWQLDVSNRASDWFFENIPNDNAPPEELPHGSGSDLFVERNRENGTRTILTIPMIGWTPKSRDKACGFSISLYGEQERNDRYFEDCGNGILPNGDFVTGNDPNDISIPITPVFVQDWIEHLMGKYGPAGDGGVTYYNLDNEPMLWNHTHRDVHPEPVSYDEMRDLTYAYASAIKETDPTAQTLGPVTWGWTAYFYSALDQAEGGQWWDRAPDQGDHDGLPFTVWYLQQMQAYEEEHGVRILDYLDLHYYPQTRGVPLGDVGNSEVQQRRLTATRSLWDRDWVDESWIDEPIYLIPRMHEWVNEHYPGTKIALTEYNFGGLEHINGTLAQADILGIFGREGLDLATLWRAPDADEPGAFAFRMYRNYDGQGGQFGDQSLLASSTNQDELSIYASQHSNDGSVTIMVINKTDRTLISPLTVPNATTAQLYRYSPADLTSIQQLDNVTFTNGSLSTHFPPNSITLFVLPAP